MITQRQKPIDPCKVAIYIRWSTEDQGEGTTLDVQLEGCRHYALSQGWAVSDRLTFIDDGVSGGSLDRPALRRLRAAVERGDVECVVVFKLDRLSRDVPDMIRLIMDEWDGRCVVKSAREPIDTQTQAGKMFFYTLASYAEWERTVIKERTFSGKLRRAQEGKNPGMAAPYGYALNEGAFAIVPHEAEVVRRIFAMYRAGHGAGHIAVNLNREGVPFRQGRPWNLSTVKYLLRNEAYKGNLVYGQRGSDARRKRRVRNEQPYLSKEGVFPVIIAAEEWDLVQALRAGRPSPATGESGRAFSSEHLLTGLLRCGCCGQHQMRAVSAGEKYRYYACPATWEKGRGVCGSRRIQEEALDQVVVVCLKRLYGSDVARRDFVEQVDLQAVARETALKAALAEAEAGLGKIETKRKKLRALVLENELSTEEYRAFVQDVEEESQELEQRRQTLRNGLMEAHAARSERVGLVHHMERLQAWEDLTRTEQKALLRAFIVKVEAEVTEAKELRCDITWRVPVEGVEVTEVQAQVKRRGRA